MSGGPVAEKGEDTYTQEPIDVMERPRSPSPSRAGAIFGGLIPVARIYCGKGHRNPILMIKQPKWRVNPFFS